MNSKVFSNVHAYYQWPCSRSTCTILLTQWYIFNFKFYYDEIAYALKTLHIVFLSFFSGWSIDKTLRIHSEVNGTFQQTFMKTSWPWPLTYQLDLDILTFDLGDKIQVNSHSIESGNRHTDRHTMSKLLHLVRNRTWVWKVYLLHDPDQDNQ